MKYIIAVLVGLVMLNCFGWAVKCGKKERAAAILFGFLAVVILGIGSFSCGFEMSREIAIQECFDGTLQADTTIVYTEKADQ